MPHATDRARRNLRCCAVSTVVCADCPVRRCVAEGATESVGMEVEVEVDETLAAVETRRNTRLISHAGRKEEGGARSTDGGGGGLEGSAT